MTKKPIKEILISKSIARFAQKGYKEPTIKDIGNAAKVNPALVYYYFKDKEEILYIIIERSTRNLINILIEIQAQEPDPLKCLERMIVKHVIFSRE